MLRDKVREILVKSFGKGTESPTEEMSPDRAEFLSDVAQEICQLFPKSSDNPEGYRDDYPPKLDYPPSGSGKELKADESKLLTDKQRQTLILQVIFLSPITLHSRDRMDGFQAGKIVDLVVAKTASLKDAECQEKIEGIIIELSERIRVDGEGAVIIRVGTQTEKGVAFNDWWKMFRSNPSRRLNKWIKPSSNSVKSTIRRNYERHR